MTALRIGFGCSATGCWRVFGAVGEEDGGGGRLVTRAKNWRSDFSVGHGRVPRRPMPREGVEATMRVRGGRDVSEEGGMEFDILEHWKGGRMME